MDPSLVAFIFLALFVIGIAFLLNQSSQPKEVQRHTDLKNGVVFFSHECGNITWTEKKQSFRIPLSPGEKMKGKTLQEKVKSRVPKTPVNSKLRITDYAWDLVEVLTDEGLLPKDWEPVGAYHFCNGVVMVRYMEKPKDDGKTGTAKKDLYFSTEDGHLIYLKS